MVRFILFYGFVYWYFFSDVYLYPIKDKTYSKIFESLEHYKKLSILLKSKGVTKLSPEMIEMHKEINASFEPTLFYINNMSKVAPRERITLIENFDPSFPNSSLAKKYDLELAYWNNLFSRTGYDQYYSDIFKGLYEDFITYSRIVRLFLPGNEKDKEDFKQYYPEQFDMALEMMNVKTSIEDYIARSKNGDFYTNQEIYNLVEDSKRVHLYSVDIECDINFKRFSESLDLYSFDPFNIRTLYYNIVEIYTEKIATYKDGSVKTVIITYPDYMARFSENGKPTEFGKSYFTQDLVSFEESYYVLVQEKYDKGDKNSLRFNYEDLDKIIELQDSFEYVVKSDSLNWSKSSNFYQLYERAQE